MERIPILLASARTEDARGLEALLEGTAWNLIQTADCASALAALRRELYPIVLCDRDVTADPWQQAVKELSAAHAGTCVILLSPVADRYLFNEVVQNGGFDVLTRPFEKRRLLAALDFAYTHWKTEWPPVESRRTRIS